MIHVLAVGKRHEMWIRDGIERYEKRLKRSYEIEWVFLPHSAREGLTAREEESRRLLGRLSDNDNVILLDEHGELMSSPELSQLLVRSIEKTRNIVMIIGGAYGVDETIRTRAQFIWSLSPLVFPHQLVRLMLIEQIYRSQEIAEGKPYHHGE